MVLLVGVFQLRVRGGGFAVGVVAGAPEVIHALAAAKGGITGRRQFRLLDLLDLLDLHVVAIDVPIIAIVSINRFQASVRRCGVPKGGVAGAGGEIGPLAHAEGRITR